MSPVRFKNFTRIQIKRTKVEKKEERLFNKNIILKFISVKGFEIEFLKMLL